MRVSCSCCVTAALKITLRAEDIKTQHNKSGVAVSALIFSVTGKVVHCKTTFYNPNADLLLTDLC